MRDGVADLAVLADEARKRLALQRAAVAAASPCRKASEERLLSIVEGGLAVLDLGLAIAA